MMKHSLLLALLAIVIALGASGCVDHYCGPAYPNSTDPFCSIRPTMTPQTASARDRYAEPSPA